MRRASFFRPSPAANLAGVEEGHLVWKVPFFVVSVVTCIDDLATGRLLDG
jgi:hypothetical protein